MRRTALYLGGLLLATGATVAAAVPAQASPVGCRSLAGYGTYFVLLTDLDTYGWDDPYIFDGIAFVDYDAYQDYYPRYRRHFHPYGQYGQFNQYDNSINNSFNQATANNVINFGGLTSIFG